MKLAESESDVEASAVEKHISPSSPRYTFYHYPGSEAVFFIYTCPSGSSIKERMLYASSRSNVIGIAEEQGLRISKKVCTVAVVVVTKILTAKIEGSSPDEITADRLDEEVNPSQDEGPKRGFARPRRPGR